MYSKFENFMKKYLAPLADKMDKEVHLSAVKKAMVAMTPLLIIGSFCLIPEAIPNMIGEKHVISQWILANLDIIYIPYNVGMALMSVYVTVIIAYQLATSYKLDIPGCVTMGLVSFLMLVVEFTEDGGISKTYLGLKVYSVQCLQDLSLLNYSVGVKRKTLQSRCQIQYLISYLVLLK